MVRGAGLTEPEGRLVLAAVTGELADLQAGDPYVDDQVNASGWDSGRVVRAEVLADLLTGVRVPETGPIRAVRLRGARITGCLDLEDGELVCPLLLDSCALDEPVSLGGARAQSVRLARCLLPGVAADQLRTVGDLSFTGCTITGTVSLRSADVGADLDLREATIGGSGGLALDGDGLVVRLGVYCDGALITGGEMRLSGTHIGGRLSLDGAQLRNPGGCALGGDGLTVGLSMFCRNGFAASGEIRLRSARLSGQLNLIGAILGNPGGRTLNASRLDVGHDMYC